MKSGKWRGIFSKRGKSHKTYFYTTTHIHTPRNLVIIIRLKLIKVIIINGSFYDKFSQKPEVRDLNLIPDKPDKTLARANTCTLMKSRETNNTIYQNNIIKP